MRARALRTAAAAALVALGVGSVARAVTTAPGVAASDIATDFPNDGSIGPVGVALDDAGRIYVAAGRSVYRFPRTGGSAAVPATRLTRHPLAGRLTGLAFGPDGRLYLARRTGSRAGGVLELDPDTGAVRRNIIDNLPCPTAVAVDPVSGDLFVSTVDCGRGVLRVTDPARGRPKVSVYAGGIAADGLTFDRDGTLYVAHAPDERGDTISAVAGTRAPVPGLRRGLAAIAGADGTALGTPATPEGLPPFLIVNRHDGRITRVDLATGLTTDLMAGGTRGDLAAVGPDGCLYATQTDRIIRVSSAFGGCHGPVTTGGASEAPLGAGLVPTTPLQYVGRPRSRCGATRTMTLRLRGLRRAKIVVRGRVVRRLGGRAVRRRVVLRGMPRGAFRLTIVAVTRHGRHVVIRRRVGACGR